MLQHALGELIGLAGLAEPQAGQIQITGDDPVFPTRYRIAASGAAAIAAAGYAAAELWRLRSGSSQSVAVDARAAAAALRSNRYLQVDGKTPDGPWDPLSGFYPVRDRRWISIHCNFPHHRDAALKVLGTPQEREAALRASATWDGFELEDAIHAAGGCAGLVRSAEEWLLHPQSAAVATQPLLEILRIGDAPPEPLPAGARPLEGVRVLDLTRVLAGPTCARALAEHGADVLKITAPHLPDSGAFEFDTGIGKRAAHLDLRDARDVETLRELASRADVFSQSYRPGALAGRGFAPEDLAQLRPGIVCVSLSAWGGTGPWHNRRGFDTIVQAVSGMALVSADGAKPKYLPVSAIDYISGYLMALGTMVALARRTTEGGSWLVRVALARTGRWITDQGQIGAAGLRDIPEELNAEEIAWLTTETKSPLGRIRHLRPVAMLSETPTGWTRPPVPLGYDRPAWEDAGARQNFNQYPGPRST
jgi:crotonobetainyl-CoA:carnitine CoA-transferase CaiB-like acyl-CoA transferase